MMMMTMMILMIMMMIMMMMMILMMMMMMMMMAMIVMMMMMMIMMMMMMYPTISCYSLDDPELRRRKAAAQCFKRWDVTLSGYILSADFDALFAELVRRGLVDPLKVDLEESRAKLGLTSSSLVRRLRLNIFIRWLLSEDEDESIPPSDRCKLLHFACMHACYRSMRDRSYRTIFTTPTVCQQIRAPRMLTVIPITISSSISTIRISTSNC